MTSEKVEPKTTADLLADARKALAEHEEAIGRHMKEALKLKLAIVALGGVEEPLEPQLPVPITWPIPTTPGPAFPWPVKPLDIQPPYIPVVPQIVPYDPTQPWGPIVVGHGGNCACPQCCPMIVCNNNKIQLDPNAQGRVSDRINTYDFRGVTTH